MPFYVSLAKINSNRLTRKISITTYLSIFSKNFYDFLPDTNDQVYIFEKHEQEYILGKIRDLFDKDILDERYKVAITDILEKFLNTGNLVVNNKIEMPKNKAELLYGFFFSFCKEKQKSKANAFTTFIRGVFESVASEKTLNHNWNKYKRQYNEQ